MPTLESSAAGLVVGATDPEATTTFLAAFGLGVLASREVGSEECSALYGHDRTCTEVAMVTPGALRPRVWVVGCDVAGDLPADFERRPRAFDIYTASMDEALDHLAFVGIAAGPVGTLSVGPVTMRQCLVAGPDGLAVVLVESSHRRASILDGEGDSAGGASTGEGPLFSEGHSLVWCVDSMDDEAERLVAAGLTKGMDLAFEEPEVSTYLGLPRSPVPIRMTMLSGPEVEPLRLELLEFPADGGPVLSRDALAGGLWALRFEVQDLAATADHLASVGCAHNGASDSSCALTTPGGIRLQLLAA